MILGLDCATKKTGFSVFDYTDTLVTSGVLVTSAEETKDRIKELYSMIKNMIFEYDIEIIVLEDVPVNSHSNLKVGKDLATLQGVVLAICFENDIQYYLYNPSAWRSVVGTYNGTRDGMKRDVQKQKAVDKVNELYNLSLHYRKTDTKTEMSDDDQAEAILIARAYILENKEAIYENI
jgi:Holliday junction resolvasome RuvABC endonuclease subunit